MGKTHIFFTRGLAQIDGTQQMWKCNIIILVNCNANIFPESPINFSISSFQCQPHFLYYRRSLKFKNNRIIIQLLMPYFLFMFE